MNERIERKFIEGVTLLTFLHVYKDYGVFTQILTLSLLFLWAFLFLRIKGN